MSVVKQLESFIECVRDGSAPRVTAEDGKRVIDVAERILLDIQARKKAQWAAT